MFESLLANTSTEGLSPLGTAPQRSFELVSGTVRDLLGERHAALFAEPVATQYGDRFDWYASSDGKARPLTGLDEDERAKAEAILAGLVGDIASEAAKLLDSAKPDDQRLGEALQNALRYPADESVFILGSGDDIQPVLVNWAWVKENQKAVTGSLSDTRAAPVNPTARGGAAGVSPDVGAASVAVTGSKAATADGPGFNFWWLMWLGWLLLTLMIGAILYLMIEACALKLPGLPGNCPGPGASASEIERQTLILRDRIAAVERQIGIADRACQPERAAAIVPDTDQGRLASRGGREGLLTISVLWDSKADLHLDVTCPGGGLINFDNRNACGGKLDVGGNHKAGSAVSDAVESMYFDAPTTGTYSISVFVFDTYGQAATQPFRVRIKDGDNVEMFEGTATRGKGKWSMNYTVGVN